MFDSFAPAALVTVPEISPPSRSTASMFPVVFPALTATIVGLNTLEEFL